MRIFSVKWFKQFYSFLSRILDQSLKFCKSTLWPLICTRWKDLGKFWKITVSFIGSFLVIITFLQLLGINVKLPQFRDRSINLPYKVPQWDSIDSYKIVILHFNEICPDGSGDIGYVIARRLRNLSIEKSLNIEVYYNKDLTPSVNFGDSSRHFRNELSADLIIYGDYMSSSCSGEGDEICLKYETTRIKAESSNTSESINLLDISAGALQSDIDDILYYFQAIYEYNKMEFMNCIVLLSNIKKVFFGKFLSLGNCYSYLGSFKFSIPYFNTAISIDSTVAAAYINRGRTYAQIGNQEEAIKDFDTALSLSPNDHLIYIDRAQSLMRLGKFQDAHKDLDHVLQMNSESITALAGRSIVYHRQSFYEKALADLNSLLELDSNFNVAYFWRGTIYSKLHNVKMAENNYKTCISRNPEFCPAHFELGLLYLNEGYLVKAEEEFNLAIKYSSKAENFSIWQQIDSYKAKYNSNENIQSLIATMYYQRGVSYHKMTLEEMIPGGSNEIHPLTESRIYKKPNDRLFDKGLEDFCKAIELDSTLVDAYSYRGKYYAAKDKYSLALIDCNKEVELSPEYYRGYKNRGAVYLQILNQGVDIRKKSEIETNALRDLNKAIQLNPGNAEVYFYRGTLYDFMGKQSESRKDFRTYENLISN